MARVDEHTVVASAVQDRALSGVRAEFARFGHRWSTSLTQLISLGVRLDESGEWALDGSPTCAHWIAAVIDVEVGTAREWLRIGRALDDLPATTSAFHHGDVSFTKVRSLTRIATAANEAELLDIAGRTPAAHLGRALAAWSARNDDELERHRRHRRERRLAWRTEPDGMVTASLRLMPEQAAVLIAGVDAHVMRSDGREPVDDTHPADATDREIDTTASRRSHRVWASLAQQRVDALVDLIASGGGGVCAEVILHVRADGCTLDDGTPIAGSVVERIADSAVLRAMIHDAEAHPINVSGRHRHHTDRQKRVVKERDRRCVDCGSEDFLQYDHNPAFEISRRTLVEETELRCSRCHDRRHRVS
jgi:hypothetical protein